MNAAELVKFHVNPITARFCWLLRSLAPVAERMLIRLTLSTLQGDAMGNRATVQVMLLPTVNGKLNVWAELGDAAALGLHELCYSGDNKVADKKPTWEVPVKQLACIIEQNSDGWDKQLAFSFRPKSCFIRVISTGAPHTQDNYDEDDFLDELEMPITSPISSSAFSNEYTIPAELLSSGVELCEPRIPRPKAFCRPPPNLPALLKQLAFMRDLRKSGDRQNFTNSCTTVKDSRHERMMFCEVCVEHGRKLELSAWSVSRFSATYDQLAITDDRQQQETARCMVLIDPLSRVIRSLQLISESAVLSSGMQAVLAVLDEHAVVLYVQMSFGTITFYIPAFIL